MLAQLIISDAKRRVRHTTIEPSVETKSGVFARLGSTVDAASQRKVALNQEKAEKGWIADAVESCFA